MGARRNRSGFTLIEVLIVVVILAVLAGTIIPQFSTSTKDARESALRCNIQLLRRQLEMYKLHHVGALPDGTGNLQQLLKSTNADGVIGAAGPSFPYGPYIYAALPPQPFSGLSTVRIDAGTGVPAALATPGGGYIYRPATGQIWVDHPDYVNHPDY
jgi:prepilin-type N-terminal cleavage/methylation domain-containing protein